MLDVSEEGATGPRGSRTRTDLLIATPTFQPFCFKVRAALLLSAWVTWLNSAIILSCWEVYFEAGILSDCSTRSARLAQRLCSDFGKCEANRHKREVEEWRCRASGSQGACRVSDSHAMWQTQTRSKLYLSSGNAMTGVPRELAEAQAGGGGRGCGACGDVDVWCESRGGAVDRTARRPWMHHKPKTPPQRHIWAKTNEDRGWCDASIDAEDQRTS